MARYLIQNGVLVLEDRYLRGDLLIDGEKIAAIGEKLSDEGAEVVSAEGCLVFPGFIDANVSFEPEGAVKAADDFYTGTRAALAGGTTTVIDCAVPQDKQSLQEAAQRAAVKAKGKSSCDYSFHLSLGRYVAEGDIAEAAKQGYTSFAVQPELEGPLLIARLNEIARAGGLAMARCENRDMVAYLAAKVSDSMRREVSFFPTIHPDYAEAEGISRFLYYCEAAGANALVCAVSSAKSVSELRKAHRALSISIYSEVCPQHLSLTGELYGKGGFMAAKYVCDPPLRSQKDVEHLKSVLSSEFDLISSGHVSYNQSTQKVFGVNDFTKIPAGLPTVENRGDIAYLEGVAGSHITDHQFAARMSTNAAKLFGMYPQKGVIAVGSDADLVVFDPAIKRVINATSQRMAVDYNPFEGTVAEGQARAVFLRGRMAAQYGVVLEECTGREIKRKNPEFYK